MIAYKLFRKLKDGNITSLFINNTRRLPVNEWLEAENIPTKNFKIRPYWHCTGSPIAPHLSMKNRVWMKVEIEDNPIVMNRPEKQGGVWYLAKRIKILN